MMYIPVLTGETPGLRAEVEGLLDGDDQSAVAERISELDRRAAAVGNLLTIGTEIEFTLVAGPGTDEEDVPDKDSLYLEIVREMQDTKPLTVSKGNVVFPDDSNHPLLLNERLGGTFNPDQPGTDISETKTNPARAEIATDRYWANIGAIGKVAGRHGMLAMLQATHLSTAVIQQTVQDEGNLVSRTFVRYSSSFGGQHLAATQHNLNAAQLLQIHSGLEEGITVAEAFPNKDGSTAVHNLRLENRHPFVGIIDPRIDALASLAALNQVAEGTVPQSAKRNLRPVVEPSIYGCGAYGFDIDRVVMLDPKSGRFVLPAQLEKTSRGEGNAGLSFVAKIISGDHVDVDTPQGEQTLKDIFKAMRVDPEGAIHIDPASPYRYGLAEIFGRGKVTPHQLSHRVLPHVSYDSPRTYTAVRQNLAKSATVRRMFGSKAMRAIIPAQEAAERRQALIDSTMVVTSSSAA
jgi:hypothetical protein